MPIAELLAKSLVEYDGAPPPVSTRSLLDPQPHPFIHGFEWIEDPWHPDAFKGLGPDIEAQVANPNAGARQKVLACLDWCENVVAIYCAVPPGRAGQVPIFVSGSWFWP